MAKITADRVLETSTTTGTGALTLAGAVTGYRAASAVCANLDTFDYYAEAVDANGLPTGSWETGLGTWGTGGILTRTTIYASSNAGAAVSWAAGTKRIGLGLTAQALIGLLAKQDTLISGTNIKTINGATLLGAGDLSTTLYAQASSRSGKDANDIYTTVAYRRADNTLIRQSVLSGGTSPEYTTRTETIYAADGTTVLATLVYTLTYTAGDLTAEDLA